MTYTLKLKRGLDLRIEGAVTPDAPVETVSPAAVAVCPGDFEGFLPRLDVREGDAVAQGQPLMHDKNKPGDKTVLAADRCGGECGEGRAPEDTPRGCEGVG